ncbi:hypothetical protein NVP1238B_01, partial [Vibrio phage 1.238.B._10N.261.52.F10]
MLGLGKLNNTLNNLGKAIELQSQVAV